MPMPTDSPGSLCYRRGRTILTLEDHVETGAVTPEENPDLRPRTRRPALDVVTASRRAEGTRPMRR